MADLVTVLETFRRTTKSRTRLLSRAITQDDQYRYPVVIDAQLRHHKVTAASIFGRFTETARREPRPSLLKRPALAIE